jgi:hypothetical protein
MVRFYVCPVVDGVVGADRVTRLRAPRGSRGARRPHGRRCRRRPVPSRPPNASGPPTAEDDPRAGRARVGEAPGRNAGPDVAGAVPSSPRAGIASTLPPSGPESWWRSAADAALVEQWSGGAAGELVAAGRVRKKRGRVKRPVTTALWLVRVMTWSWPSFSILDEGHESVGSGGPTCARPVTGPNAAPGHKRGRQADLRRRCVAHSGYDTGHFCVTHAKFGRDAPAYCSGGWSLRASFSSSSTVQRSPLSIFSESFQGWNRCATPPCTRNASPENGQSSVAR